MFDQEQQKVLYQSLFKLKKQFYNHNTVYEHSGFDEEFDEELKRLVIHYAFDFQAIAFHLYFLFPKYSHRLKPQAISYRWYQLTLQRQGKRIKSQIQQQFIQRQKMRQQQKLLDFFNMESEQIVMKQEASNQLSMQQKKKQLDLALKMATVLDEQQQCSFMVYRPKFIVDSQFKLERKKTEDTQIIEQLMNKQYSSYGSFEPPQAAPIGQYFDFFEEAMAAPNENNQIGSEQKEQEQYLDDDWQAYESD